MTAPTPPVDVEIGDVIEMVRSNADNDGYLRERISQPERLAAARKLVASGRWVIVDPQPQEEQGQ